MGELLIGTSGFSYDDWRGEFYPEGMKKGEMLPYYAQRFPAVEVNSSFYVIPGQATFASMADRTPDRFMFAVKANKQLTHDNKVDPAVFGQFIRALDPLLCDGRLGCVLAQYPWSFKKDVDNIGRVRQLSVEFGDIPVVVEFRNSSWIGKDTFEFLRDCRLGYCCVDEPRLKGLMPGLAIATSHVGYVRFHGRNALKWWRHEKSWERYDYLYRADELRDWTPKVRKLADSAETTYVFFNNHYKGQAAKNAQMFMEMT